MIQRQKVDCSSNKKLLIITGEEKMEKIIKFLREEDGMELSEYAVVGGILLVGAVAIITTWGGQINATYTAIVAAITP